MEMQTYLGVKLIKAIPMTRGAYNDYRGWQCPADEDPADAGYLVEYVDGGKSNHPSHEGYISWSPADVFAKAHILVESIENLLPHQVRVAAERAELVDRLRKLQEFLRSDRFDALPRVEKLDLYSQERVMCDYANILRDRLQRFQSM